MKVNLEKLSEEEIDRIWRQVPRRTKIKVNLILAAISVPFMPSLLKMDMIDKHVVPRILEALGRAYHK